MSLVKGKGKSSQQPGYGHAYERLIELGPEKLAIVEGKMAMAEPAGMIVDFIQQEWGLCLDVKRRTLMRQINRYRHHMVTPKMAVLYEANQGGEEAKKAVQILYEQVNVIDGLEDLLQLQLTRIQKGVKQEAPLPTTLADVSREIDLARKLYVDLGHLRMETGSMPRATKKLKGTVVNPDGSRSAFEYMVEKEEVPAVASRFSSFLQQLDASLGYERTLPADPSAAESAAEGHHPD